MKKAYPILLLVLSMFILASMLGGCRSVAPTVPTTDPTTEITDPTTTAIPDNTWTMEAALVNDKGEVLETMVLTATVMLWEQEALGYYSLSFDYPVDIRNSASGVMPSPDYEKAYNCCSGFGTEKGLQGKVTTPFYIGFDPEAECFIVDFDDEKEVYLIAYRAVDADLSALWEHFQDFITMRPDSFPTIIG